MAVNQNASSAKKALIVKFGAIGDVIMAIPAVRELCEQGFAVDWVCGRAVGPLLERYSWINPICIDDRAMLRGRLWVRLANIIDFWKLVMFRRYDLCAVLYYDPRYRILVSPIRARRKLALSQLRESSLFPSRPRIDECARVLLGLKDDYRNKCRSPIPPDDPVQSPWPRKRAPRRIAIVPGGTNNLLRQQIVRRWPVENYVALAKLLLDRGWEVALLGNHEDAWVRPHFQHLTIRDSLGELTLPEVISACDSCDAVVSHDTGPLHLAGLSGACLVGIFGPTDPSTFLPRRPSVIGIWGGQGFACRPCYDGRDFAPCQFNGCMHQVTPELVLHELDKLLAEREGGTPSPWRIVFPEVESYADTGFIKILPPMTKS